MKLIFKIFWFLSVGLVFSSCQDMLTPEPDNSYGDELATQHAKTAFGFLNTAYVTIPNTYDFSECATDDAVMNDPISSYIPMVGGAWSAMYDPTAIWNSSYKAIANINKFMSIIPSVKISWSSAIDDSLYRKRWIGEAFGMRAYHHFMLLRYYGGVGISSNKVLGIPYFKNLIDVDPTIWSNVDRPLYSTTVNNIAQELDSAIAYLPMDYVAGSASDRVLGIKNANRISKRIAYGIKAELYMHAASPKYNGGTYNVAYCDSAIKYSSMLIDLVGGVTVLSGTLKKTQFYVNDANQTLADILWRFNPTTEATTADAMASTIEFKNYPPSRSGKGQVNPTQNFVDAFPAANGYPISDVTNSKYVAATPYLNRDSRLDSCVIRDGGKIGSSTIKTSKDDTQNGIENPGATRTGYYLKKLLRPDFNISPPVYAGKKTIRPLIRYTEIFLIYAEAATGGHDADWKGTHAYSARDIIKAIRKRAGVGLTNGDPYANTLSISNFMDLVRNERRIELAFEGFRFWDLRRWGLELNGKVSRARILVSGGAPQFLEMSDEPRNFNNFKYFAPIPNAEILKCQKLEQNAAN